LKDAGIEPLVTLYHFDMPQALEEKGGGQILNLSTGIKSMQMLSLKILGNEVKKFITFNEPYIEFFLVDYMLNPRRARKPANVRYANEINSVHHELMASAEATQLYHSMKLNGMIGITFNLSPCLPFDTNNTEDVKAVSLQDELLNGIVLDPVLKGNYPAML
jgi:beta-glucosidase